MSMMAAVLGRFSSEIQRKESSRVGLDQPTPDLPLNHRSGLCYSGWATIESILPMEPVHRSRSYTYRDYLTWPPERRCELINGLPYAMAPAPSPLHQEVVGEIYRQLANALEGRPCRPLIAPVDVRLPRGGERDEEIDTVVQPDVLVVCDHKKLDLKGVRGAPDLVVEVVSPQSAFHDHQRKRELYERAGVREYWIVDPWERLVYIYRLSETGSYGKPTVAPLEGEMEVSILDGVRLRWESVRERIERYAPFTAGGFGH